MVNHYYAEIPGDGVVVRFESYPARRVFCRIEVARPITYAEAARRYHMLWFGTPKEGVWAGDDGRVLPCVTAR